MDDEMAYEVTETREYDSRGIPRRMFVITVTDHGRVVMTFHTGNEMEANEIGPRLIEFLGF